MTRRPVERVILAASAIVLLLVGAGGLLAPAAFYASYGIDLSADVSLVSELRGIGAALVLSGAAIAAGVFRTEWAFASAVVASVVLLGFGLGRVVSLIADGVPAAGMLAAGLIELALGAASAGVALRRRPSPLARSRALER